MGFVHDPEDSESLIINYFKMQKQRHCQFSGRGDLIIETSDSMVVISTGISVPTEPSPNNSDDETFIGVIEAKNMYQLYANMVLGTTIAFVGKIKRGYYKSKDEILKCRILKGNGLLCTGIGGLAFYKLSIDLKAKKMSFMTKELRLHVG